MAELTESYFLSCGYSDARQLESGIWIGLQQMAYTTGLFVGLDEIGYHSRYCYEKRHEALIDFAVWEGQGDPTGPWIKHKGGPGGDRLNPRLKDEEL
jgi:hypothetical protein